MQTDEEQVENIKKWWQENGRSVIAGIVLGVGGLFGYRCWVDMQETSAATASSHFEQMIQALEAGQGDTVMQQADLLIEDYSATEYATMARFALSRHYVSNNEFDKAQQQLQQIVGTAGNEPLGYLARKRLASIQLQLDQLDQALTTLSADFPVEFNAGVEELKGDIYVRQGKKAKAVEAYRQAQNASPGPANAGFLQNKLDDLGKAG